jgi:hypothetical protein
MRFLCPDLCDPQHKRVSELTYTLNNFVLEEFQVLMAAICWDAVPCIIVEISHLSEVLTASIIRVP